jgi:Zn-dependent M28 family amino/carboxypeptidase
MVGSPNFGRFYYDGDNAPPGSARIEQLFRDYFAAHHQPAGEIDIQGASDHAPFAQVGIPVGGVFTGADEVKSPSQAGRYGGTAGRPYDACYHRSCDALANVNVAVLAQLADAGAVVALRLAG